MDTSKLLCPEIYTLFPSKHTWYSVKLWIIIISNLKLFINRIQIIHIFLLLFYLLFRWRQPEAEVKQGKKKITPTSLPIELFHILSISNTSSSLPFISLFHFLHLPRSSPTPPHIHPTIFYFLLRFDFSHPCFDFFYLVFQSYVREVLWTPNAIIFLVAFFLT